MPGVLFLQESWMHKFLRPIVSIIIGRFFFPFSSHYDKEPLDLIVAFSFLLRFFFLFFLDFVLILSA